MPRMNVVPSARGRWLAGATVIAGTMLVSACGSSHPTASPPGRASSGPSSGTSSGPSAIPGSGAGSAPAAAPSTVAAAAPATAPASPAVKPTAPVNPGGPDESSTQTCAYKAAHDRFILISQAQAASTGALTV
ncbi:MAG TPA: hypothetical protein VGD68_17640, partial [Streptosporangiaceae bacterium]